MFQPELETMPAAERHALQDRRLAELLVRLRSTASEYWREKLRGVEARGTDEIGALPFTTKAELRDAYPFGTLAVDLEETVRVHASSGTRGKPLVVAYTAADIELFAEVNARALVCAGARPSDILHVAYGYGLFTGGLGLHYGGERLGATVVPASGGNPGFQVGLMADLGANGLGVPPRSRCSSPSPPPHTRCSRAFPSATASSAPSPGRRRCARSSRQRGGSTRATSTVSRR